MGTDIWKEKWVRGNSICSDSGQGFTFLCQSKGDKAGEWPFVLKILKRQQDKERRGRMFREVVALKTLDHSNIAKYCDSNAIDFDNNEELYLVTEYVIGPTLTERLANGKLQLPDALVLTSMLLDVLEYCHSRNIIHRDIKPDNIILRNGDVADPVLLDFGLSFNEEQPKGGFDTDPTQQLGNRFLALPELLTGEDKRDKVSDITQCVAVLFFCITGKQPHLLQDAVGQPPHRRESSRNVLSEISESVRRELFSLFDTGFAYEQYARYQSISSLRQSLQRISHGQISQHSPFNFKEELTKMQQEYERTQGYKIRAATADLLEQVYNAINETAVEIGRQLANHLNVGLIPITEFDGQFQRAQGYLLTHKHDTNVSLRVVVGARVDSAELIIMGVSGETTRELLRVPVLDDSASLRLVQAIQMFYTDSIQQVFMLGSK